MREWERVGKELESHLGFSFECLGGWCLEYFGHMYHDLNIHRFNLLMKNRVWDSHISKKYQVEVLQSLICKFIHCVPCSFAASRVGTGWPGGREVCRQRH